MNRALKFVMESFQCFICDLFMYQKASKPLETRKKLTAESFEELEILKKAYDSFT